MAILLVIGALGWFHGCGDQKVSGGPSRNQPALSKPSGRGFFSSLFHGRKKNDALGQKIVIAAAGDIMLHRRALRSTAQKSKGAANNQGYDEMFPGVAEALQGSDLRLGNLEFPVFPGNRISDVAIFYGTPPALYALKKAGFTVLSAANNHAYDQGQTSPASTARECGKAKVVCLGVGENRETAARFHLAELKGVRLAIVAYTLILNSGLNQTRPDAPHVNGTRFADLLEQVRSAAEVSDGVVVSLHWGEENLTLPLNWQRDLARELVAAGAALILGHHSHVLGPIEPLLAPDGRRALAAYSLGNFVSSQGTGSPEDLNRLGVILKVTLLRTRRGLEVESWGSLPTWIQNRNTRFEGELVEDIHVEVVPQILRDLEQKKTGAENERRMLLLEQMIAFYRGRAGEAQKLLGQPKGQLDLSGKTPLGK